MLAQFHLDIEDPDSLIAYLRQAGRIDPHEQPRIRLLAGGVSNRTVWVRRATGEEWVLKQALAKLRVPVDWFSSPQRIHREALGLRWLQKLAPRGSIPAFVFEDFEHDLLAMQAVAQPHTNWKTMLLDGKVSLAHVGQFATLLACVHREAFQRRAELAPVFADRSFFESLRLEPYYAYTAIQVPAGSAFLSGLIEATRGRSLTLTHGDYSPKNILVRDERLILLDHEVIHFGDPAFDIGFSLTHLLSKAHHLPAHRQGFQAAAGHYWRTYTDGVATLPWSDDLESYAIRHTLACLLARIDGRSPLEYLSAAERRRQRAVVLELMAAPPDTIPSLIRRFIDRLS